MPVTNTKTDEARQVAEYWDRIAPAFDSIYAGKKNLLARRLDHWLRKDMYQRFDWVMRQAEELRPATVCDIGCGYGATAQALADTHDVTVIGITLSAVHCTRNAARRRQRRLDVRGAGLARQWLSLRHLRSGLCDREHRAYRRQSRMLR